MDIKIEVAVDDPRSLGEGAIWDPVMQKLLWIDITRGKIFIYHENDGSNKHIDLRQTIGTVVPYTSTKVIAAVAKGICIVDIESKCIVQGFINGNPEHHMVNNRWNDGKCDPEGRLWVGSMDVNCNGMVGALYSFEFDPANEQNIICKKQLENVGTSNGIVWTKDGTIMYYIDTQTLKVDAFDFDGKHGTISNRRCIYDFSKEANNNEFLGYPDGMTIDENDTLWIAMWDGWSILHVDPLKKKIIGTYKVPSQRVTSCAFGGANLDKFCGC